jgi:hypothetical protein
MLSSAISSRRVVYPSWIHPSWMQLRPATRGERRCHWKSRSQNPIYTVGIICSAPHWRKPRREKPGEADRRPTGAGREAGSLLDGDGLDRGLTVGGRVHPHGPRSTSAAA